MRVVLRLRGGKESSPSSSVMIHSFTDDRLLMIMVMVMMRMMMVVVVLVMMIVIMIMVTIMK